MKSKESWLLMEIQETLRGFNKIEEKMRVVARTYELDKYKLHIEVSWGLTRHCDIILVRRLRRSSAWS